VYRDPEGVGYLEQNHNNISSSATKSSAKFSEEDYKKRIEDLNIEIKGLTKELEMVIFIYCTSHGSESELFPHCTPTV